MNKFKMTFAAAAAAFVASSVSAMAAPALDGTGFGLPSATVAYNPAAPENNFGTPGPTTDAAAYNIFAKSDATNAYFMVQMTGVGAAPAGIFANLYFGTGASALGGSDLGFEVTNRDAFIPGVSGSVSTVGTGIDYALLAGNAIEFVVPFAYLETDPQALGFDKLTAANPFLELRLSQSYGYSVAGGATYGPTRLALITAPFGATTVPEPITLSLFGAGLAGAAALRRRRSKKSKEA